MCNYSSHFQENFAIAIKVGESQQVPGVSPKERLLYIAPPNIASWTL